MRYQLEELCNLPNNKKQEKQQKMNEAFDHLNEKLKNAGIEMYLKQC
jgi:hypothetical protein